MNAKQQLQKLTGKKYIYLLDRCNTAIKFLIKKYRDKTFLLQDQGGWLTYRYAKRKKFLKTNQGVLNKHKKEINAVYLINSMPGYFAIQPMRKIPKGNIVINDVSGSIGSENAKKGDIIIGSFGKWKPINLEYGGFLASNQPINIKENFDKKYLKSLEIKLNNLPKRLEYLKEITDKIKKDLNEYKILQKEHNAINVIVEYKTEKEKNKIIKYCKDNNLQYTECPRYIRTKSKAISIEVKRL